jgi:CshA-type fibril repeat protein
VSAEGSATAGATVTPLNPATATVNIGAQNQSSCTASLSGTALTTAGNAVQGALVTLTNSSGTALTYPNDYPVASLRGQVVSTVTDASGQYSFPYVVAGSYAVRFTDVVTAAVTGTSVVGGSTTSEATTAITELTSAAKALVAGAAGVINATYTAFPTLTKKFFPSTVAKGQISTLVFTLTNSPGNAAKSNLGFVDTLPQGVVVDTNSNMMTTCPAGGSNVTRDPASMTATTGVVTVTNASISSGVSSCEYSIAVRADTAGTYTNDASNVTTTGLAKDTLATKVVTNDIDPGKFSCDANMYHIINSQLYRMDPRDTRLISYEIGPNTLSGIDAIGYNNQDGYMYGIATSASNGRTAGNLVRITSSGVVTDLGAISGVTTANMTGIKGGDFDDAGNLVVHSYLNSATIYSINVLSKVATVITASAAFPAEDMAYSNGYFYSIGWDGSNSKLFTIRKSDWTVTTKAVLPDQSLSAGEGIFVNGFGELIIVRTPYSGQHKLWRLSNPQTVTSASEWVLMGTGDGAIKDGAMCHNPPVPTALADFTTGPLNTAQSVNLLTNDVKTVSAAGVATNFNPTTVRLCDPATNQVAPNCTVAPGATITVANVGTYSVDNTGVVTFTPENGYTGTPTPLGYQVSDANGQVGSSTYTPTVSSTTPVAMDNSSTGAYNTPQTLNILANDIAGTLSALDVSTVRLCTTTTATAQCASNRLVVAGEGTYDVNPDGTVTFTPLSTFKGTATTIKYVVQDGIQQTTSALINVIVSDPAAPAATAQSKTVIPGATATFTTVTGASGLATAPAAFNTSLTCLITPASNPAICDSDGIVEIAGQGIYTLNPATGIVTYVADSAVAAGTKTEITYRVTDIFGQTASSTLTPIVPPAPTADNETSTGAYNTPQTIDVLTGDAAGAGATLNASSVKLCETTSTAKASCTLPELFVPGEGTYNVNANGTITFTPLDTFKGPASLVKYVVADSTTQLAEATIRPTVSDPAAPVATAQSKSVIPGATATFTTITGTSGLATAAAGLNASLTCLIVPASNPAVCDSDGIVEISGEGIYTLNTSTGVVTYVADSAATAGSKTVITYQVTDITGQKASANLTPVIPPAPTADNETSSGAYNTPQTIDVLTGDAAGTGATLNASTVKLCATTSTANASCNLDTLPVAGQGVYSVNPNGTVTFTPYSTFSGDASPVKYAVADSTGQFTGAEIRPTVALPNVPVAASERKAVIPGGTATFTTITGTGALATSGVGLVAASTCLLTPNTTTCAPSNTVSITGEGVYTLNPSTGIVTFVADPAATQGDKTSITYQVTDTFGQKVTATLTPVIPAPPAAVNDLSNGAYNTAQVISILTNDTVTSPATLVASTVKLCATTSTANASCNLDTLPVAGQGVYTVNPNGTVTFTPYSTFSGSASPVKYVVADSTGQLTGAQIFPTVGLPDAPVATAERKAVIPGGTATFTTVTGTGALATSGVGLVAASTCLIVPASNPAICDADGIVEILGQGTFTLNPTTGVVTYVADPAATQGDKTSITYQVTDTFGQKASSTLTPVIPAPPAAVNDLSNGAYNTAQVISILTNDTVTSPATLVASTVKLCATTSTANASCALDQLVVQGEGAYKVNANGTVTFTPLSTFSGPASPVKYAVADSTGQLTGAQIFPTVGSPEVPAATPQSKTVIPGGTATFTTLTGAGGLATAQAPFNASSTCLIVPASSPAICDADGIVEIAGEGVYTLNPSTGIVTFVADPAATVGQKTSITYQVTDIFGQTAISVLTPIVPPPPTADNETSTGAYNTAQVIDVLTGDAAGAGATLNASSVKLCATTSTAKASCNLNTLEVAGEGTYRVNANGTVTFTPLSTFKGQASFVKYVVADSTTQLAEATIRPFVSDPAAPVATPQTKTVIPGGTAMFTTLTGTGGLATAPAPFNTSVTCLIVPASSPAVCDADGIVEIAGEGTYTLNPSTGIVTFVADRAVTPGTKTSITYKVTDIFGQTAVSTLTPTVPEPLVIVDDSSTGPWNTAQKITPLTNDKAGVGSSMLPGSVQICASTSVKATNTGSCSGTTLVIPGEGTYKVSTDGSVRFVPLVTFWGNATPISYSVTDSNGQIASAIISVVVQPPKTPVAKPEVVKVTNISQPISFTTLTGSKGLAASAAGLNRSRTCLIIPASEPAKCDADGVVVMRGEGTYKLDKKTGMVTFLASATAKPGKQSKMAYQVTDKAGQKIQSFLMPILPDAPKQLPVTGATNSEPLLLGGLILLSLGLALTRGRNALKV